MARSLPHQAKQSATESANAARPGAISRLRAWGWGALAVLSVLTLVGIAARAARVISRKMEPLADAVRR